MPVRSRPGLLDEGVEHDHPVTVGVEVQCASDAVSTVGTELEETAAQRPRPRHAQIGPELHEQFDETREVGKQAVTPAFDLGEDSLVEVRASPVVTRPG